MFLDSTWVLSQNSQPNRYVIKLAQLNITDRNQELAVA